MSVIDATALRVLAIPGMQRVANIGWGFLRRVWPWRSVLRFFLGGFVAWARKHF